MASEITLGPCIDADEVSPYEQFNHLDELASDPSTINKADIFEGLVVWLTKEGDRLRAAHEAWDESIRRGDAKLDTIEEKEQKRLLGHWLYNFKILKNSVSKFIPEEVEYKISADLLIVEHEIREIYDNWKTPRLYICKSMRKQVVTGAGIRQFEEMLRKVKAQRTA
jgi:hypothetical protein